MVHVQGAVVERVGRIPDHVRFSPVAEHADAAQVLEQGAAALAATDHAQRQLAATALRFGRGDDVQNARQARAHQRFEHAGQRHRFAAQGVHAGALEQVQRRTQRCQAEDRRIAQLPALGTRGRDELRRHLEAGGFLMAPPASEAWQGGVAMVPLMHERASHRSRSAVEVLVVAPHGEIRPGRCGTARRAKAPAPGAGHARRWHARSP
ncbi:hypothetical protein G6F31_017349 [Rhizopus arrhizus]|nr:hypothetical protein G6F31_017349 [Rhizopus arrhizus]